MTDKNIFVYKLLLLFDVSDFSFFFKFAPPPPPQKKISSFFSSNTPLSKLRSCLAPLFESLVRGSNPQQKGGRGCTLWSCHIIFTWLIIVHYIFTLNSTFTTFIKPKSICLFLFHIPTKLMINKEKKKFSVVISVCCGCIANVMLWNIYFPGLCFPAFYGF